MIPLVFGATTALFLILLAGTIAGILGALVTFVLILGLFFAATGYVNAFIGNVLWEYESRKGFWMHMGHGLILFVPLAITNVFLFYVPSLFLHYTSWMYIANAIPSFFLSGLIGKYVASEFTEAREGSQPLEAQPFWPNQKPE